MNPKISILVPVYNVETYLRRCLDSILAQSFTDYEVILANDGSTDLSSRICDEYAERDERFRVFHRENFGISATREFALFNAKGDFVQFVDSDDWIEPDMLEVMYQEAINQNADIVGCCFREHWPKRVINHNVYYVSQKDFIRDVISSHWGVVWNKLFSRQLFADGDIHFPEGIDGGEDYVVCVKLMLQAKKIVCVNRLLYNYNRFNVSSTMNTMTRKKVQDQIDATEIIISELKERGLENTYDLQLQKRKFNAKMGLMKISIKEWARLYPECNFLVHTMKWGRQKIKALLFNYLYGHE